MDRTHRIGQHRPINVTRLIIENSIEARILDLQKKKENLAASTLGDDDKAMGRVSLPTFWPVFLAVMRVASRLRPPRTRIFDELSLTLLFQLTPEDLMFLFSLS